MPIMGGGFWFVTRQQRKNDALIPSSVRLTPAVLIANGETFPLDDVEVLDKEFQPGDPVLEVRLGDAREYLGTAESDSAGAHSTAHA